MRIDKFAAEQTGISRSDAKELIKRRKITVNGAPVTSADMHVDPEKDEIIIGGKPILYRQYMYIMLNKPAGVVCATRDELSETVLELIPPELRRKGLFPAGRLDKDTEGLLLITNDGALSHRLLSPKSHVSKVYEAVIDGKVTEEDRQAFAEGLDIGDDKPTLPAELTILETTEKEPGIFESRILITICEGRFHQIKRMFEKIGKTVVYLKRLSMGSLELDPALPKGSARLLTQEEKAALGIADAETQKGK